MRPTRSMLTLVIPSLMLGAGIATLSYLGFDAVSTLAEDTKNPERDIGFATVLVCILQTVFCFLIVYLAALAWPPLSQPARHCRR